MTTGRARSAAPLIVRSARRIELVQLAALQTAAHAADGVGHAGSRALLLHALQHPRGLRPADVLLAATVGGRCVGFVELGWFQEPGGLLVYRHRGHVHPDWRRQGIGTGLVSEAQARLSAFRSMSHPPQGPAVFGTWHYDREGGAAALLDKHGYRLDRTMLEMVRPLSPRKKLRASALPSGLRLRSVDRSQLRVIWDAFSIASADDEGAVASDEDQFLAWRDLPQWNLELWQVAWDGDHVAGMVLNYINETEDHQLGRRRGYTEYVNVLGQYRRRGLASALLELSAARFASAGASECALDVNGSNVAAIKLYTKLGYEQTCGISVRRRCLPKTT